MALGLVVVASVGSAAGEVITDGATGRTVVGGDPEGLAAVLLEHAASPTVAAQLAAAAVDVSQVRADAAEISARYRLREADRTDRTPASSHDELVSVVIPLWNQGHYLADAIGSVRGCGHQNVEIVVVDDGSTEPETIAAFDALQDVVKVRQPNAGLSAARNAGIAASSGRYVIPLDADDLLPRASFPQPWTPFTAILTLLTSPAMFATSGCSTTPTYPGSTCASSLSRGSRHPHARYRVASARPLSGLRQPRSELAQPAGILAPSLATAGYRSDVLPVVASLPPPPESMTFSSSNAMRLPLLQYLLRKHAPKPRAEDAVDLPLLLAHLWKTHYEPSASVRLQLQQLHHDGHQPPPPPTPRAARSL